VKIFSAHLLDRGVMLSWQPIEDIYEPTATADYYILYTRVGNGGFDAGRRVDGTSIYLEQRPDEVYSYKITAVNSGGESLDSEIISACRTRRERGRVMVINGFDRVSAPISYRADDSVGFHVEEDSGVGYIEDIAYIGAQHDYDPLSDNLGLSLDNYATNIIAGNSFDNIAIHGSSIAKAGYSYASASRAAVEAGVVDMSRYDVIDIIMGKQRTSPIGRGAMGYRHEVFSDAMRAAIDDYVKGGGAVIISGSYVISDVWNSPVSEDDDRAWVRERLGVEYAGKSHLGGGIVYSKAKSLKRKSLEVKVNRMFDARHYAVEACDIITPLSSSAESVMSYDATDNSAAVISQLEGYRCAVLGFPIEVIIDEYERDDLMRALLKYMTQK
jgi:hypothetical protein